MLTLLSIRLRRREGQVALPLTLMAEDGAATLAELMIYLGSCQIIQTDGGSEFEGDFADQVSDYTSQHRIARPYRKNEQAFIERFNRTVRQECLGWHKYTPQQLPELQSWLNDWLHYYHFVRPSMAFESMRPPLDGLLHLT